MSLIHRLRPDASIRGILPSAARAPNVSLHGTAGSETSKPPIKKVANGVRDRRDGARVEVDGQGEQRGFDAAYI